MKKFFNSSLAVLAIACAVSCEETKPEPKTLSISGGYSAYVYGGGYGWQSDAKVGVFAVSELNVQNNLEYKPSETTEQVIGSSPEVIAEVELLPVSASVEYNTGAVLYAYYPYSASATDVRTVVIPDISVQDYQGDPYWTSPCFKYAFAYAKLAEPLTEYSTEVISMGEFTPIFVDFEVIGTTVSDELNGKFLTEVMITSSRNISLKDATIDLTSGEITGTPLKSIKIEFPAPGYEIKTVSMHGMSFTETPMMNVAAYLEGELTINDKFSVTYKIDGQDYSLDAMVSKSNYYDAYTVVAY